MATDFAFGDRGVPGNQERTKTNCAQIRGQDHN